MILKTGHPKEVNLQVEIFLKSRFHCIFKTPKAFFYTVRIFLQSSVVSGYFWFVNIHDFQANRHCKKLHTMYHKVASINTRY